MQIPQAFREIAEWMHQDLPDEVGPEDDLIDPLVASLSDEHRRQARDYIAKLLESGLDEDGLEQIWIEAGAEGYVTKGMRWLLTEIRDRLDEG